MLVETYLYVLINVIFSTNVVLGTLENSFVKQRTDDLGCGNSSSIIELGTVGNVIACSRICSSTNGCRGFYFNEANGACWGSNLTECQTDANAVFYRKDRQENQQTTNTTTPACDGNCTAPTDCGVPVTFPNADVSAGGTLEGDTRTYSCSSGYVLRNVVTLDTTCQSDATWSTPSFDCLFDCGAPSIVTNAAVSGGDTVDGTIRTYTCNVGYVLSGSASITCQTGATWSAVAFSCLRDCGAPSAIANTDVSAGGTLEGDTRTYTCSLGYALANAVTLDTTCQPDGLWTVPSFDCLLDCGTPLIVPNAAVSAGDTVEGATRTYTCDTGYAVSGSASITCQAEATWSQVAFSCLRDCGTPSAIPNAVLSAGGTLEGDIRTYTCFLGYAEVNVITLDTTCQLDGLWTVPSFNCVFDCGLPPTIPFATVSGGGSITGSTRTYTCDSGYSTAGSATTTCMDGTGWSAPTSICTQLVCDAGWYMVGLSCYFTPGGGTGYELNVIDARDICHSYNAYLIQLETETESNAVESWFFSTYPGISPWLGITDAATEGVWVWMNSTVPATWTDWNVANAQPNGGTNDNYARLRTEGDWGDMAWDSDRQPLCEKSAE